MTDQPTPQTAQHCSGCKRHWCSGVDAQARTEALDVEALAQAMNSSGEWPFNLPFDVTSAQAVAREYAAILAAKADR